jgi:hypothetical protein
MKLCCTGFTVTIAHPFLFVLLSNRQCGCFSAFMYCKASMTINEFKAEEAIEQELNSKCPIDIITTVGEWLQLKIRANCQQTQRKTTPGVMTLTNSDRSCRGSESRKVEKKKFINLGSIPT